MNENKNSLYCLYYQATIERSKCWFLVAVLRSFEHVAFDRTLDVASSRFEFYVPADMEPVFLQLMDYFQREAIVTNLERLPNRLMHEALY